MIDVLRIDRALPTRTAFVLTFSEYDHSPLWIWFRNYPHKLEPYHFYERTALEFKNIKQHAISPEDLAINTEIMYFRE